jgi:spoIIIJ-associated protein
MTKITVSGKTVEEAIRDGLEQLGVPESRVRIEVLEQPSKGLFGLIGSKEAKVSLEVIPDPIDQAISFLRELFDAMGQEVAIERIDGEEDVRLNLSGKELGLLIGRRGQTLDALQYLTNIVANRHSDRFLRVILDAENFRERRRQTLEQLSERLAERVVRTGKEIVLEPMTPQERRVIHFRLQNHPKVKTYSKGEEPNRRVVITLK